MFFKSQTVSNFTSTHFSILSKLPDGYNVTTAITTQGKKLAVQKNNKMLNA